MLQKLTKLDRESLKQAPKIAAVPHSASDCKNNKRKTTGTVREKKSANFTQKALKILLIMPPHTERSSWSPFTSLPRAHAACPGPPAHNERMHRCHMGPARPVHCLQTTKKQNSKEAKTVFWSRLPFFPRCFSFGIVIPCTHREGTMLCSE